MASIEAQKYYIFAHIHKKVDIYLFMYVLLLKWVKPGKYKI